MRLATRMAVSAFAVIEAVAVASTNVRADPPPANDSGPRSTETATPSPRSRLGAAASSSAPLASGGAETTLTQSVSVARFATQGHVQQAPPDWFKRATQALEDQVQRAIVPIYAGSYERGSIGGTGTLFRIDDATFLVTAAHVTDQRGGGTLLALSDGPDGSVPTPLRERFHSFPSPYDVAVVRLAAETTAALPSRTPLTLADVDLSRTRTSDGRFAISGFPLMRSGFDYALRVSRAQRFTHEIVPYRGDVGSLEAFSADTNLAFTLDRYASADTPSTLKGISGCSVLRLARDSESPFTWTPQSVRIIAVQTSEYRRRDHFVVRATIWPVVMELLWREFPDLRPAMQVTADHQRFRIRVPT